MIKKYLYYIYIAIAVALFAWIAVSFVDIAADNTAIRPLHSDYNFFVMLLEVCAN